MTRLILVAALLAVAASNAAQAHHGKRHHHHVAPSYPDSVMLDGKVYKVCKPGMQDDCVEPRQAGLGHGIMPTLTDHPHHRDRHHH